MSRFPAWIPAAAILLLAAPAALAQSVHEVKVGGDTVTGTVSDAADVERIPFRLPEGAVLSLSVKAGPGSALHPAVSLRGIDRLPDEGAEDALVAASKGNAVSLKNRTVGESGLRWLEIRGADGTTGSWILTLKAKLPTKAAGGGTTAAGTGEFAFVSPGNCTGTLTVAAGKGSAAVPVFASLLDPSGKPLLVDLVTTTSKGFTLKDISLGLSGTWRLRFTTAADGAFGAKGAFKVDKPVKRTLTEEQVIADPALLSVNPASGDVSQVLAVALEAYFVEPGAVVTFRKPPVAIAFTGTQLAVGPSSVGLTLNVQPLQRGLYSVDIVNPDGGQSSLPSAFEVKNASPRAVSVLPATGQDDEVATLTISGSFLLNGMTATLLRGSETIPGTGLAGSTSVLQGTFDLRGHTQGTWDLVLLNPEAPAQTLSGAFQIVNAPPSVLSMTPASDRAGSAFTATVTGAEFEGTPTLLLRRTGTGDIAGTAVNRISGTTARADFDTTGASAGARDLVFTNPDGKSATLSQAFWVGGVAGPPVKSLGLAGAADGPPSVAYDATRDEYAMAWVERSGGGADILVQRLDAKGTPLGNPVSVSTSASSVAKRDAVVAWDSTDDEYLVAWSEIGSISVLTTHPSYPYNATGVYRLYARRMKSSDLTPLAAAVQATPHTQFSGWYADEFNNFHTTLAWNPAGRVWNIVWMQEWSTSNVSNYGFDDYDVLLCTYAPASGTLGAIGGIASSGNHEGDPCALWDAANSRLVVAYNSRASSVTTVPLRVYLTTSGIGSIVATSADDLEDPRIALDPTHKRLLVTWTRAPASGNRVVEAVLGDATNLGTVVGSVTAVGSGGADDFLARPLYNDGLGEGRIAWTRLTGAPALSAMSRRVDCSGASGLTFLDAESEASGGSGDEAVPAVAVRTAVAETAVFWLKTMTLNTFGSYSGSPVPGTYTGTEIWLQRYR